MCSKLTAKTPERRQWHCSGVFIVNFEHISHLVLMFQLLTLSFEHVISSWIKTYLNFDRKFPSQNAK